MAAAEHGAHVALGTRVRAAGSHAVIQQNTLKGDGSSAATTGVPYHMWVSHWIYFMCTAAPSVFTLQDKGGKGKQNELAIQTKAFLSLLGSRIVLLAGRSCLQGAAVGDPPALHTNSATGAPSGCPTPSLRQARQGRKQGSPSWGGCC